MHMYHSVTAISCVCCLHNQIPTPRLLYYELLRLAVGLPLFIVLFTTLNSNYAGICDGR